MKKTLLLIAVLIVALSMLSANAFAANNLLTNPSFEQDENGQPAGWQQWQWEKNVANFALETGSAQEGQKFVTITNKTDNDARYKQTITVKENAMYKLSCWIKTENIPQSPTQKGANLSIESKLETTKDIFGTNGKWEYVEMYARTGSGISTMTVTVGLGSYGREDSGKASFDNVVVEEVNSIPEGVIVSDVSNKTNTTSQAGTNNTATAPAKAGSSSAIWFLLLGVAVVLIAAIVFYRLSSKKSAEKSEVEADEVENTETSEKTDNNDDNLI